MSTHETSIDVAVPVRVAYNQWTQFESFPQFMRGVEQITQTDATHTHWTIRIGGVSRDFDAEITEQVPDQRIAWKSTSGPGHGGVVTFHHLADSETRVMLQLDTEPEGLVEKAGEAVGMEPPGQIGSGALQGVHRKRASGRHGGLAWRGQPGSDELRSEAPAKASRSL